jgi:hypothetical protein
MYSRAANADKDAQVPACPSWVCRSVSIIYNNAQRLLTFVPLAVRTRLVTLELHEVFQSCAILLSTISGRVGPPRHGGVKSCAVEDVSYKIAEYESLFGGAGRWNVCVHVL